MSWICRVGDDDPRWIEVHGPWRNEDGKVSGMTADQQIRWAESIGCRLPTAEEFDAIWYEADVAVVAVHDITSPLTKMDADVANALMEHGEPTESIAAGKTWIESERATKNRAVNYGLHVPAEETTGGGSLRRTWRGITVRADHSEGGWVIQTPGAVHGYHHADWSQLGYAVRDVEPGLERVPTLPPESDTLPPPVSIEAVEVISEPPPTERAPVFAQAHDYQPGRPEGPPLWVVIHTAECAEVSTAAENLQAWAKGDINASWHYAVDNNSVTQSVRETDRAWAVGRGPAHERGIHIELSGTAHQTPAQWRDAYSTSMLAQAAALVADICGRHYIPVARCKAGELRAMRGGITGHVDVRDAWHKTTHSDPGKHFPWDDFLKAVARHM